MKFGIFGGTFNPIHNGHINIALKIYDKFSLDKILFMPNKIPPHKNIKNVLDEKIRLDMINIAIKNYEFLDVEDYELKKDNISYTYESLEYLDRIYKGIELFFIIGSDSFLNFDKWQKIERIFRSSNIVVYLRKEAHKDRIIKIKERYEELYKGKIYLFFDKIIDISSTEIREKIFNGDDISNLVPKCVYEYIISKGLYRESIMDFEKIDSYLKENLNEFRYQHTLRVVDMGIILANKHGYDDILKVKLACYFHDAGKNLSPNKILDMVSNEGYKLTCEEIENVHIYHGVASMIIARDKFNINDMEVLNAIKNHVTGVEKMTILDKIVFLADFFEMGRDFDRVHKSRDAAIIDLNLDEALILAYDSTINELVSKRRFIHENTIRARNFILRKLNNCC